MTESERETAAAPVEPGGVIGETAIIGEAKIGPAASEEKHDGEEHLSE
jgi:hypothetical protein